MNRWEAIVIIIVASVFIITVGVSTTYQKISDNNLALSENTAVATEKDQRIKTLREQVLKYKAEIKGLERLVIKCGEKDDRLKIIKPAVGLKGKSN